MYMDMAERILQSFDRVITTSTGSVFSPSESLYLIDSILFNIIPFITVLEGGTLVTLHSVGHGLGFYTGFLCACACVVVGLLARGRASNVN